MAGWRSGYFKVSGFCVEPRCDVVNAQPVHRLPVDLPQVGREPGTSLPLRRLCRFRPDTVPRPSLPQRGPHPPPCRPPSPTPARPPTWTLAGPAVPGRWPHPLSGPFTSGFRAGDCIGGGNVDPPPTIAIKVQTIGLVNAAGPPPRGGGRPRPF